MESELQRIKKRLEAAQAKLCELIAQKKNGGSLSESSVLAQSQKVDELLNAYHEAKEALNNEHDG